MNLIGIVSLVCRLLLVAAAVLSIKKFSLWPKRRPLPIVIYGILIIFFIAAQLVFVKASALTDEITLTALGDKNPNASAEEIYVHSFLVDGKNVLVDNPISGKWFWIGDTYAWRIENDTRQPKGTTRSITLKVPVGWSRTANFEGDIWRGKVQITTSHNTWVVDTYAEQWEILSVELGRSNTASLILNEILHLMVFAAIMFAGVFCCVHLSKRVVLSDPTAAARWWEKNGGKVIYGSIALISFCAMFWLADRQSLDSDEIAVIDYAKGTLKQAISPNLYMTDATPPLFNICTTLWYRIAPYGQRWLLLISMVPAALMAYIAGLIAERIRNRFCGVLTVTLIAFSGTVWAGQAHELRSYAFMGLFSTITFYYFIQRNETPQTWKYHILFGLSMMLLAMSHYFGMLACGCLFLVDLMLFCTKKIQIRAIIAYLIVGGISLAWLVAIYTVTLKQRSVALIANWHPVPSLGDVQTLFYFLTGNQRFTWNLFLLGIVVVLVILFSHRDSYTDCRIFYFVISIWMIFFPVAVLFIYGNYVNRISTMWQPRYFFFSLIYIALVSALGVDNLIEVVISRQNIKKIKIIIGGFLVLSLSTLCIFIQSNLGIHQMSNSYEPMGNYHPYRESADWLNKQSDYIYNEDTLVISSNACAQIWEDYFITQQGKRDTVNTCKSQYEIMETDLKSYNRIYLQHIFISVLPWLQTTLSTDFVVEEDYPEFQITVYQRNGT